MKPLWKLCSGEFAGCENNGLLYNSDGQHIGHFNDKLAINTNGQVVGEMYDDNYIGYKLSKSYSLHGSRGQYANLAITRYADRTGRAVGGWEDPHF